MAVCVDFHVHNLCTRNGRSSIQNVLARRASVEDVISILRIRASVVHIGIAESCTPHHHTSPGIVTLILTDEA